MVCLTRHSELLFKRSQPGDNHWDSSMPFCGDCQSLDACFFRILREENKIPLTQWTCIAIQNLPWHLTLHLCLSNHKVILKINLSKTPNFNCEKRVILYGLFQFTIPLNSFTKRRCVIYNRVRYTSRLFKFELIVFVGFGHLKMNF